MGESVNTGFAAAPQFIS